MQHGEQRIPIFLDLGTLVAMLRILHRQFVQAEFPLHLGEFIGSGLVQRDPDKTFRPADILADIFFHNIGKFFTVFVRNAADQHERILFVTGSK